MLCVVVQVQNLLLHFWQGMPSHLTDVIIWSQIFNRWYTCVYVQVQNLLLHFWQGMPSHLTDIIIDM